VQAWIFAVVVPFLLLVAQGERLEGQAPDVQKTLSSPSTTTTSKKLENEEAEEEGEQEQTTITITTLENEEAEKGEQIEEEEEETDPVKYKAHSRSNEPPNPPVAAREPQTRKTPPSALILEDEIKNEWAKRATLEADIRPPLSSLHNGLDLPPTPKEAAYLKAIELLEKGSNSAAFSLLLEAARAGNTEALFTLGEFHEFGHQTARNLTAAAYYHKIAASLGHPTSQKSIAFFYDTGKGGVTRSVPQALLHYEFAAQGGDIEAQVTLGYKYLFGHGLRKDCERSADYYSTVAQIVAEQVSHTGLRVGSETHRLVNTEDLGSLKEEEDVVQYWKYSAASGDPAAQVTMGSLFLQGAFGVERDYEQARQYFQSAADQGDAGGLTNLGFIYVKGHGVEQSNATAFKYLSQAAKLNHPYAQALLGYMYLHGMGVPKDVKKAVSYFRQSASRGNTDGVLHLGNCYFYGEGVPKDHAKALQHYIAATEGGNILAFFNLAQMNRFGIGVARNCHVAVNLYKRLVERGPSNDLLAQAYSFYEEGDMEGALYVYELAAEMGMELAQSNAAWLYDHGFGQGNETAQREKAFKYYSMAAEQKNPLAHLKMGDFYYYGFGTEADQNKAALYYQSASDLYDAQATFNLGYMHQHGIGLPQDFHLAKRFYDLAVEIDPDAYLAWMLALSSLGVDFITDHIVRGDLSILGWWFGLDTEMALLVCFTVLLLIAIIARQLLLQEIQRQRAQEEHQHQE